MIRIPVTVAGLCAAPALAAAQEPARVTAAATEVVTDTVMRFHVVSHTWTWPYLLAHVGVRCRGGQVEVGTTTAPDAAPRDGERYCAGAVVEMRHSTLTLRGARGVVHVRLNRPPTDSTGQPRR